MSVSVPVALRSYSGDLPYRSYPGRYYRGEADFKKLSSSGTQAEATSHVTKRERLKGSRYSQQRPLLKDEQAAQKPPDTWYLKKGKVIPSERDCLREVLAQEFFRLLIPGQQQTRWHERRGWWKREYYISSQDVRTIPQDMKSTVALSSELPPSGTSFAEIMEPQSTESSKDLRTRTNKTVSELTGFGATSLVALLVQEIDFKHDHLVIVGNRVVKIDGDRCLGAHVANKDQTGPLEDKDVEELKGEVKTTETVAFDLFTARGREIGTSFLETSKHITEDTHNIDLAALKSLPTTPSRYRIKSWLTYSFEKKEQDKATQEVFKTLLHAFIIPDEILQKFAYSYVVDDLASAQQFFEILLRRKQQAAAAAQIWPEFQDYLNSPEATEDAKTYIRYLKTFTTTGNNLLFDEATHTNLRRAFTRSARAGLSSITPKYNEEDAKAILLYESPWFNYNFCFRIFQHPPISAFIFLSVFLLTAYFPAIISLIGSWSWAMGCGTGLVGLVLLHPLPSKIGETIQHSEKGFRIGLGLSLLLIATLVTFIVLNPFTLSTFVLLNIATAVAYLVGTTLIHGLKSLYACCVSASCSSDSSSDDTDDADDTTTRSINSRDDKKSSLAVHWSGHASDSASGRLLSTAGMHSSTSLAGRSSIVTPLTSSLSAAP